MAKTSYSFGHSECNRVNHFECNRDKFHYDFVFTKFIRPQLPLTLKGPITTAADDIHKYFFHCFSEKIRLDVSSDFSARQRIHMKNQALFSSEDKSKKLKCHLLPFLFGALRVNICF